VCQRALLTDSNHAQALKNIFFVHSCLPAFGQYCNLLQSLKALSKISYAFLKILVQFKACVMSERYGWCARTEISAPIFTSRGALISQTVHFRDWLPQRLKLLRTHSTSEDNITSLTILNPWTPTKFWNAINKKDHVLKHAHAMIWRMYTIRKQRFVGIEYVRFDFFFRARNIYCSLMAKKRIS